MRNTPNDWPWRSAPCPSTPMARMQAESPAGFNSCSRRPSASVIAEFDADLIASLAGVRHGNPPAQPLAPRLVSWEQSTYALDLTTAEERRLTRVLEKLQAGSIGLALALETAAEQLSAPSVTLADVKTATASLTAVRAALERRRSGREVAGRWIEDLSKITTSKDLRKTGQVADSVYEAVDDVLNDALISVTYALALGDPQGTILFAGNVSRRHDFGFSNRNGEIRLRAPWTEPEPRLQPGVPWHVRGSLLGLDLGLSSLALRRTTLGALPEAPTLIATDKDVFTKTIVLLNMFELHDGDRDAIAEAIARGRQRIVGACRPHRGARRDRGRDQAGRLEAARRPLVARARFPSVCRPCFRCRS